MRTRTILALLALALAPGSALAGARILVSGKLDAANSHDFSCSLVNKSMFDITVTLELKDAAGNTYVDPSTFQPVTTTVTLESQEAAMLTAPANFAGVTSLYCWADVPEEATVFGTHSVRDAQDRATAATPLKEDVAAIARGLAGQVDALHSKLENKTLPGRVTGYERFRQCTGVIPFPAGTTQPVPLGCPAGQVATGGGCEVETPAIGAEELFRTFRAAPQVTVGDVPFGWECAWRNHSANTESVNLCTHVVCVDDGGPSAPLPPP